MANPTILDTFVETINSLATSATVSAAPDRKFYYITLLYQATDAIGLTGLTYGGQSMYLRAEATINDRKVCAQLWTLDEAGIAAAVGNAIVPTGGTYDNQSSIHFSMQDCYQWFENMRAELRTSTGEQFALGREDESFTFSLALSETAANIPTLANPVATDSFTFTNGSVAYGFQNDTYGVSTCDWSVGTSAEVASICFNLLLNPPAFTIFEEPKNTRVTEIRSITVQGAQAGLVAANFDVRLDDGTGEQATISNVTEDKGGVYTINYVFDRPTTQQYSNTGFAVWVSDGTNSAKTSIIPYLPPFGRDFVDVVSPNASADVPIQYGDTFVTGDQCEYDLFSWPDRLPFSLDASLNGDLGTVPIDQTVKVCRITSAGVAGTVEYIDFLDATAPASTEIIADYRFREAEIAGQEPVALVDEIDPSGNNMTFNYASGAVTWGKTLTGRFLNWASTNGAAFKFQAANSSLFSRLDGNTTFTLEFVFRPQICTNTEGRLINMGVSTGQGDLMFSPIGDGTSMITGFNRPAGINGSELVYPPLTAGELYHVAWVIDTTQTTNTNRLKLYVNGELQTPTSGLYPALNDTININVSSKSILFGNNANGGNAYEGSIYRACFRDCAMTEAQIKSSRTQFLVNSDASYATPVDISQNNKSAPDSTPTITGTINRDYEYPQLTVTDASGNDDFYAAMSTANKWEINSKPFIQPPTDIFPILSPTQRYTFSPYPLRLQNGDLWAGSVRGQGHAGKGLPSSWYARKAPDDKTWGAEYEFFGYTGEVQTTAGTSGFVHPVTGELYLIFVRVDDGEISGKLRRYPEDLVKGDVTATTFAVDKRYSDESFYRQNTRVSFYDNGWPIAVPWDRPVEFGGRLFQSMYGINQAWMVEWDDTKKQWSNKQWMFNINEALGINTTEISMVKIDETRAVFIIRGTPATAQYVIRGEFDSSGNLNMIDDINDPESQIQFADTMLAGCTMRGILVGDDVFILNGARNPVFQITTRRFHKEDVWNNRRVVCGQEFDFLQLVPYNATVTVLGSNSDFGMPEPIPVREEGSDITYTLQLFCYDTNGVLIPLDPGGHHETFGLHMSVPIWRS